ncbi:MAG: hypothetical protein NTX07_04425 [Solirubrobacterales bacterium]|nr:hypothetical protein [Solirubrobacterales bacterium]
MSGTRITDELIDKIAKELAARYDLGEDAVREVGSRLAEDRRARSEANEEFARRFMAEHAETFRRLGS